MANADIHCRDCVSGMQELLADNSVSLVICSPPFEELFSYSSKLECLSNNGSTVDVRAGRYALNMRFFVRELFRVLAIGSNACIHIQQLLSYKNQHGFTGRRDFRGAMIDIFMAGGFHFIGEAAVPKNPQALAQRLNLMSLQFKSGWARSSTIWAPAPNDYVLIFQKPGEPAVPVRPLVYREGKKPTRREVFFEQIGHKSDAEYVAYLRAWALKHNAKNPGGWLSADDWIAWACGVWLDIEEIDILDGARGHKETGQEKHVCCLQLEVIRRCILLYSNPISIQPDVLVLDPFMGIGSTAYVALGGPSPMTGLSVDEPRNVIGFELKESYHRAAVANVKKAREASKKTQPADMFQLQEEAS